MTSLHAKAGAIFSWMLIGLSSAYAAGGHVRPAIIKCANFYADYYRVPRELVHAVIEVESEWQPAAVSSKGAVGVMQLMPATAASFGVRSRFVFEQNIRAGVAHLAWLMARFRADLRLVTAAYFAGERRVAGTGLVLDSPEVHGYVQRVAAAYRRKRVETLSKKSSEGGITGCESLTFSAHSGCVP